jgi:excisionase family DNA binding protein
METLLLTADEVATELRVSKDTVYDLAARGALPPVRIGRSRRYRREDVVRYVDEFGDLVVADDAGRDPGEGPGVAATYAALEF